jgi:N6-adenosine-specific RNA methylase IME4
LAAVLAADVAGYSRLMGADEEETLARLKPVGKTFVDPALASHKGRIVKTTGDRLLVEFASAVDAVRSAVQIQRDVARHNKLAVDRRPEHSRKPDDVRERIEKIVPSPYIELFARETKPGWDCWGDQVELFDHGSHPDATATEQSRDRSAGAVI